MLLTAVSYCVGGSSAAYACVLRESSSRSPFIRSRGRVITANLSCAFLWNSTLVDGFILPIP